MLNIILGKFWGTTAGLNCLNEKGRRTFAQKRGWLRFWSILWEPLFDPLLLWEMKNLLWSNGVSLRAGQNRTSCAHITDLGMHNADFAHRLFSGRRSHICTRCGLEIKQRDPWPYCIDSKSSPFILGSAVSVQVVCLLVGVLIPLWYWAENIFTRLIAFHGFVRCFKTLLLLRLAISLNGMMASPAKRVASNRIKFFGLCHACLRHLCSRFA